MYTPHVFSAMESNEISKYFIGKCCSDCILCGFFCYVYFDVVNDTAKERVAKDDYFNGLFCWFIGTFTISERKTIFSAVIDFLPNVPIIQFKFCYIQFRSIMLKAQHIQIERKVKF